MMNLTCRCGVRLVLPDCSLVRCTECGHVEVAPAAERKACEAVAAIRDVPRWEGQREIVRAVVEALHGGESVATA